MEETIKIVFNYGGVVVMAGLFVYSWIQDRTKNGKTLEELSKSNNNIAVALSLLQESSKSQKTCLEEHDKRACNMETNIKEIKYILENK